MVNDFTETCFNWIEDGPCFVSSDDRHWIAVIRRVAKNNPENVTILAEPQKNDGCIYAKIPTSYIHIHKPRKTAELTDDQRATIAERLNKPRR